MTISSETNIYALIPYPTWPKKDDVLEGVFGELKFRMNSKFSHYQHRISPMKLLDIIKDGSTDENGNQNEYAIAIECTSNVNPNINGWNWFHEHGKTVTTDSILKEMSESEESSMFHIAIWPTQLCYLCENDAAIAREAIENGQTPQKMTLHDALNNGHIEFEPQKLICKITYAIRYDEFGECILSERMHLLDEVKSYAILTENEDIRSSKLYALYDECRHYNGYANSIIIRHSSECFDTFEQAEKERIGKTKPHN